MHPYHQAVFDAFPDDEIAIVGSSITNMLEAGDIDVLMLRPDWPTLKHRFGQTYQGMDTLRGHTRRMHIRLSTVPKHVQLTTNDHTLAWADHPHQILLRDGTVLHEGIRFDKKRFKAAGGWQTEMREVQRRAKARARAALLKG